MRGHGHGSMNDDLFAELGGDNLRGIQQRRENVTIDVAAQRAKEHGLAGERDASTDDHDLDRQECNDLGDSPSEGLARSIHRRGCQSVARLRSVRSSSCR